MVQCGCRLQKDRGRQVVNRPSWKDPLFNEKLACLPRPSGCSKAQEATLIITLSGREMEPSFPNPIVRRWECRSQDLQVWETKPFPADQPRIRYGSEELIARCSITLRRAS